MPIYDYVCASCRHRIEVIHRIDDPGPRFCPACGAEGTMRKAVGTPAVHFKGSGWAKKDRSSASRARARSGSDSSSGGGGEGSRSASDGSTGDSAGADAGTDAGTPTKATGDRTSSGNGKPASDVAGPARSGTDSSKGAGKPAPGED